MSYQVWTTERIERLRKHLANNTRVSEVIRDLKFYDGVEASNQSVEHACKRYLGHPVTYWLGRETLDAKVARAAPPPPQEDEADPLQVARIHRTEKAHAKRDARALEAALSRLEDSDRSLEAFAALASAPPAPVISTGVLTPGRRECCAVALLSDVHYGSIFSETASTYGNATNPAIIALRVRRYFAAVAWKIKAHRSWADIDTLVLSMLGDNVEGQLHEETVETAQPALQSLVELFPLYLAGIRFLMQELAPIKIVIVGSWGNHGRDTHRVRFITGAKHSVDWVLYQQLAASVPDGVTVHADEALDQYITIYGRPYHQQHGLSIRYQGGVGGLSIPLNKAAAQWDKRTPATIDTAIGEMGTHRGALHAIGHWHQLLFGSNWFTNGSIKGYDPYVSNANATPEDPRQWFFLIDSKRGPTEMSPLWVGKRSEELVLR